MFVTAFDFFKCEQTLHTWSIFGYHIIVHEFPDGLPDIRTDVSSSLPSVQVVNKILHRQTRTGHVLPTPKHLENICFNFNSFFSGGSRISETGGGKPIIIFLGRARKGSKYVSPLASTTPSPLRPKIFSILCRFSE